MARRANLKKGIKGPMKMKSGSYLEPNKELKFGGVKKYKNGTNPPSEGEQVRQEWYQSLAYNDAKELGKLREWYRANPNAPETKKANAESNEYYSQQAKSRANRDRIAEANRTARSSEPSPRQKAQNTGQGSSQKNKQGEFVGNRRGFELNGKNARPAGGEKGRSVSTLLSALDNTASSSKSNSSSSTSNKPKPAAAPKKLPKRNAGEIGRPSSDTRTLGASQIKRKSVSEVPNSSRQTPSIQRTTRTVPKAESTSKKEKRSRADRLNDKADRIRNRPVKREARKEERQSKRNDKKSVKSSRRSEINAAKANLKSARKGNMTDRRKSSRYTDAQANAVERAAKRPMKRGGKY